MRTHRVMGEHIVWSLITCVILITGHVHGSVCSTTNRNSSLDTCLVEIKALFVDTSRFWFGTQYNTICPNGPAGGIGCRNQHAGVSDSLTSRVFPGTAINLDLIDRFMQVTYISVPGTYIGCGATFVVNSTWVHDVDPTSDDVVRPWYVKNTPDVTWDTSSDTSGQLYTLVVYDAGYFITHGIYININGSSLELGEPVNAYHGPLIMTSLHNPYMFILFKQASRVQLSQAWRDKIEGSPGAGGYTIPELVTALDLTGPVALNWIVATGDEYAAGVFKSRGYLNMCPLFVANALNKKSRPFLPADVMLSVGVDVTFESTNMTYNICCTDYTYNRTTVDLDPIGNPVLKTIYTRSETPPTFSLLKLGQFSTARNFTGELYTLLVIDPDVPYTSVGTQDLPLVHMYVINVRDGNVSTGEEIQSYMGPNPPDVHPHTYYFLLYKQTNQLNATEVADYASDTCRVTLVGRCLFNISGLVADHSLTLVGASWMRAARDDYVIYRNIVNNPDPTNIRVQCEGQPGYKPLCPKETSAAPILRHVTWIVTVCSILSSTVILYLLQ